MDCARSSRSPNVRRRHLRPTRPRCVNCRRRPPRALQARASPNRSTTSREQSSERDSTRNRGAAAGIRACPRTEWCTAGRRPRIAPEPHDSASASPSRPCHRRRWPQRPPRPSRPGSHSRNASRPASAERYASRTRGWIEAETAEKPVRARARNPRIALTSRSACQSQVPEWPPDTACPVEPNPPRDEPELVDVLVPLRPLDVRAVETELDGRRDQYERKLEDRPSDDEYDE